MGGLVFVIFLIWFFAFGGWAVVGGVLTAALPFIVLYILYAWSRYLREEDEQKKRNKQG